MTTSADVHRFRKWRDACRLAKAQGCRHLAEEHLEAVGFEIYPGGWYYLRKAK